PAFGALRPLKLSNEITLQVTRLNHHSNKLTGALNSLAEINNHLVCGRFRRAEDAIVKHRDLYGLSLITLKKDLFAALDRDGLAGLSRRYKQITVNSQNTAWALLAHYAYDLIDPTFDPTRATLRWLRFADNRIDEHPWYARIIQDELLTYSGNNQSLACALLRYSTLSLLDLTILLWRKQAAHPLDSSIQSHFSSLSPNLKNTLVEHFSTGEIPLARAHNTRDTGTQDLEIFRTSFFFDDIASVVQWRCQLNSLLFAERPETRNPRNSDNSSILISNANRIAQEPSCAMHAITELDSWQTTFLSQEHDLKSRTFLTAAIVAESCRRMLSGTQANCDSIAELLSSTDDVQLFASTETFDALLDSTLAKSSPLLTFVLWELL
ncbi:hypothetical protein, partial [Bradyrhizobium sp. STM 3809]|uniref:hypothetical protein n=1 Tax=Bradyrhizobium sp. STM 3809 TaxID=551936 RepID=UPI001AEC2AA9